MSSNINHVYLNLIPYILQYSEKLCLTTELFVPVIISLYINPVFDMLKIYTLKWVFELSLNNFNYLDVNFLDVLPLFTL